MKYLITGGAGFIGSHIAEEIRKAEPQAETVVYDNLSVGRVENIPEGCVFVQGDIRDQARLSEAMKGVDIAFHEVALVTIRGSFEKLREDISINEEGTLVFLEAAVKEGVRKTVFASSMAVYGEPPSAIVSEEDPACPNSPYGISKLKGELYCRIFSERHGFDAVSLRYFNTYGVRQTPSPYVGVITTFINQALDGKPMTVYGNGSQRRDFVWVGDVARASYLAAQYAGGGIFNIGSGKEISVAAVARMIAGIVEGSEITHNLLPQGDIDVICANITRASSVLGYRPREDLNSILPKLVAWWKQKRK